MQKIIFKKKVSKGTSFNQIYVPKELSNKFEVGDTVEVRLIEKGVQLHIHGNISLTDFKKEIIERVFKDLRGTYGISHSCIIGSFLTLSTGFSDIDVIAFTEKKISVEFIEKSLTDKYNHPFHIIPMREDKLRDVLMFCPMTRHMFRGYVSDGISVRIPKKRTIRANHLRYLLMMSEDLLEFDLPGRSFLKNVRKLIIIQQFLEGRERDDVKKEELMVLPKRLQLSFANSEYLDNKDLSCVRSIIRDKLRIINRFIKNGQD